MMSFSTCGGCWCELEAETDVCAEVVLSAGDAERGLDVLDAVEPDTKRGWGATRMRAGVRRGPRRTCRMCTACPCLCEGRARARCCRRCCWEGVGGREPWGVG